MRTKMSLAVLLALAVAAPAAASPGKDKNKGKDKDKGRVERSDDRGSRDRDDRDNRHGGKDDKMTICHIPPGNTSNRHTITVSESAWEAHSAHGDHRGACGRSEPGPCGTRFDRLDTNNDGAISRAEWPGDRTTFDRLDRDDNGAVTRREFCR